MANPDSPKQTPNIEQLKIQELPPDIQSIMGFQNPRIAEYETLDTREKTRNDLSSMGAEFTQSWYTNLPAMPEKDNLFLRRRLLDFQSSQEQQLRLSAVIKSGDASGLWWPLSTYEELVREYWHGEDHSYELARILKESDPKTVDEFNATVARFNTDLDRIREENDVKAVEKCYREIEALLRKELRYDTKITESFFREKLGGKILVDCGGNHDKMQLFAKKFGVKTYINVDKHVFPNGQIKTIEFDGMTVIHCGMDMLNFLAQLQSGSVSVTINGIDSHLIINPEYHAALAHEIERVVADDGIIFGVQSTALEMIAKNVFDLDAIMAGKPSRLDPVVSKTTDYEKLRIFTAQSIKKALEA